MERHQLGLRLVINVGRNFLPEVGQKVECCLLKRLRGLEADGLRNLVRDYPCP